MENITEMLKGVLEGCVLEIIGRKKTYGYAIAQELRQRGFSEVVEGTVYAILLRIEKNMLVDIEKKVSEIGPPRKLYTLNPKGREQLRRFWAKWNFLSSTINTFQEK